MDFTAIFLKLTEQFNSAVFVLLAILIISGIGLYKMGRWSQKFSDHDKRVEKIEGLSDKVIVLATKIDLIYQLVRDECVYNTRGNFGIRYIGISDKYDAIKKEYQQITEDVTNYVDK